MIQFFQSFIQVLDSPLGQITVRSSLALIIAVGLCRMLRGRSAAARHAVWTTGLLASLIIPLTYIVSPPLVLPILPPTSAQSSSTAQVVPNADRHGSDDPDLDGNSFFTGNSPLDSKVQANAGNAASLLTNPTGSELVRAEDMSASNAAYFRPEIPQAIWLGVSLLGISWFVVGLVRQVLREREMELLEDANWAMSVASAARSLKLSQPPITLVSGTASVPAVTGIFRHRLVVPPDWHGWSTSQRDCILLHELAHIKRRDVATQLLGRLAYCLHWFNPLVWFAMRQLRAERELAADDCVLESGQPACDYADQLLQTLRRYRTSPAALGVAMASSARLDQRIHAILDGKRNRKPLPLSSRILLPCVLTLACVVFGTITIVRASSLSLQPDAVSAADRAAAQLPVWKKNYTVEYPGALPVAVRFSPDGKLLVTSDTNGELMGLILRSDQPLWRWKANVGGSHPAVAFSLDQQHIYATTTDGVRILDTERGKETGRIEVEGSRPTAVEVFPDKLIQKNFVQRQIVFGTPSGYFVKTWAKGSRAKTTSSLETSTVKKGSKPDDKAVPLAVDPAGRSAVMIGPIDGTGQVTGRKGKNVLWAYVCGDYDEGTPGNRIMPGHEAHVVAAAWAREHDTIVTGDAAGRLIIWDAKTMKERHRFDFNQRVAAVAASKDGTRIAAITAGQEGRVYLWNTTRKERPQKPIHTVMASFTPSSTHASLSFSPDGRRLAGCVIDKAWLQRRGELKGKVHVWELAKPPKEQDRPKQAYSKLLSQRTDSLIVLHNHSMLVRANKQGAVDYRSIRDGGIQARSVLGKFDIGRLMLSANRRWMVMEQHLSSSRTKPFNVAVWDMTKRKQIAKVPGCSRLIAVTPHGDAVAVIRQNQLELWDVETSKQIKVAPIKSSDIAAASFSPLGDVLMLAGHKQLLIWNWRKETPPPVKLKQSAAAITFSSDGRWIATATESGQQIDIRHSRTGAVLRTLKTPTGSTGTPYLAFTQQNRVLISAMPIQSKDHRSFQISVWDMADGSLAHKEVVKGSPIAMSVSPNERYLFAMSEDTANATRLLAWRLDGQQVTGKQGGPPAAARDIR